jgi:glycosyltransferase involved in cell wall biosynthesis
LVVVEAAVHGVPALLSSVVPAQALLPDACVAFVVDDTAAFTAALRRMIDTPAEYRALRAAVAATRGQFCDRGNSWGSMLYRALIA